MEARVDRPKIKQCSLFLVSGLSLKNDEQVNEALLSVRSLDPK